MPALLTRMSIQAEPAVIAATEPPSDTSMLRDAADLGHVPPSSMSATITCAPSAAKMRAMPAPCAGHYGGFALKTHRGLRPSWSPARHGCHRGSRGLARRKVEANRLEEYRENHP
jgi:hypothetical protein